MVTTDALTETLAGKFGEVLELANELHDRLYVEPAPGVYAQAASLVELQAVANRLKTVRDWLSGE